MVGGRRVRLLALLAATIVGLLSGCLTGQIGYTPPTASAPHRNTITISKTLDAAWKAAVPALSRRFFVINNIDRSSGLINVSYSGDPEPWVDCGVITSQVKNLRGDRTYTFAAARGAQNYEFVGDGNLFSSDRRMELQGRINLIFEELAPGETRVTANTRYVLTRTNVIRRIDQLASSTNTDTISFDSGQSAHFTRGGQRVQCQASGRLETDVLDSVK